MLAAAATAFALPSGVCGRARRGERGERGGGSWLSPSALSAPPAAPPAAVPPAGRRGRAESWPVEAHLSPNSPQPQGSPRYQY